MLYQNMFLGEVWRFLSSLRKKMVHLYRSMCQQASDFPAILSSFDVEELRHKRLDLKGLPNTS